ncbi:protein TIC 22-like, chloroplastic [Argentina anserina]|uniref:protein TIC 22-like, chloroplastic n=1 Tax=Argentina anserina TaxID=57926 RepID=UPI0021761EFB|nr:protein TIC 22-like, chloroplastic [Potentilla anserina]
MNLGNHNNPNSPSPPHLNLHQSLTSLQTHCSGILHNLSHLSLFNPNPSSLQTHLQSALSNLQTQAKTAFHASESSQHSPLWARIAVNSKPQLPIDAPRVASAAMSTEAIEERLAGVPVYALSNAAEEFVLVSGAASGKSLGLFCFKKEDAESLLEHITVMDPGMRSGSKVVAVALNKVFQLKVDGVAFRLIPESSQVKNALKEKEKAGSSDDGFFGVPVFQSRSLILRSQSKSYRPVFFRKEDLENSLSRASRDQKQLNPSLRPGDIQVAVLEDVIKGMKEGSAPVWDDVVFIPPGFDISTDPTKQ